MCPQTLFENIFKLCTKWFKCYRPEGLSHEICRRRWGLTGFQIGEQADETRARTIQNVTQPEKHTGHKGWIQLPLHSYTNTHTHTHNPHDITVTQKNTWTWKTSCSVCWNQFQRMRECLIISAEKTHDFKVKLKGYKIFKD